MSLNSIRGVGLDLSEVGDELKELELDKDSIEYFMKEIDDKNNPEYKAYEEQLENLNDDIKTLKEVLYTY